MPSPPSPAPPARRSLTERVYERIRADIVGGELFPRETLVEGALAARYGTSKTPVREALLMLARHGLVESLPSRGWRVREFGRADAFEIEQLRYVLEPLGLRMAAPRLTKEDIGELRALLDAAAAAIGSPELGELSQINRRFHNRLVAKCGNSRLCEFLEEAQEHLGVMAVRSWRQDPSYPKELAEHEGIVEALEMGKPELAVERLRQHISEFHHRHFPHSADPAQQSELTAASPGVTAAAGSSSDREGPRT